MEKSIYITTTLPYVNSDPHIGFALEIVQADILARYYREKGYNVFFNTGTDEHGQKIFEKAKELGEDTQAYTDRFAKKFDALKQSLNLSYNNFIRTTDEHHKAAAQVFWKKCLDAGDIYKKNYKVKYCVGCELEKTDSELVDGKCSIHPNKELEIREEENYFFKFSKYQKKLLELYKKHPDFVVPESRLHEIKTFVEGGLEDFSISRLKAKMPWGVPVPDDPDQVMYVWFDALVNYISALGWPKNADSFAKWWPAMQFAGKDNLRQQSAMWQAMLMSADLPPSRRIIIHGFITSGGMKMSKSLGNVVNPFDIVSKYGTDALRYYLSREVTPFEDGDFTEERFREVYNANLANGLGNLVSRIIKMAENGGIVLDISDKNDKPRKETETLMKSYKKEMENYNFKGAMDAIWGIIGWMDKNIQGNQPFKKIKSENQVDVENAKKEIYLLLKDLRDISEMLKIFMPETSEKIKEALDKNKIESPLFLRLEKMESCPCDKNH